MYCCGVLFCMRPLLSCGIRVSIVRMSSPPEELPTEGLKEAFALFSETSARLSDAYLELQSQVARLSVELAAANGELARRERLSALGEVAAKLAHQLRTPLAAALLYVGHLTRPDLAEADRVRFAEKVLSRLRYLERLIQDMLLFVKGQQEQPTAFSIKAMVEEIEQVMEPQMSIQGVQFRVAALAEDVELWADRQAIVGALLNLLENALQMSPPGTEVHFDVAAGGSPIVAFRVQDQGPGIDADTQARLFEPFFTTRSEGSGLGLAIVKQTADAHGGWVEIESEPGQGSAFTFYLPLHKEAEPT